MIYKHAEPLSGFKIDSIFMYICEEQTEEAL